MLMLPELIVFATALALLVGDLLLTERRRWVLGVAIAGFWGLHGAAYIIPRYRDPVMPLLIVLAAGVLAEILQSRRARAAALAEAEHEA